MAKQSADSLFIDTLKEQIVSAIRLFEMGQAASGYNMLHDTVQMISDHQEKRGVTNAKVSSK